MVDSNEALKCTPASCPSRVLRLRPGDLVVMPGLFWLYRRRLKKQA